VFMDNLMRLTGEPMFLEGGGQLILDEAGEVVGAVGITGDVNERDDECALAGIVEAGFRGDRNQYAAKKGGGGKKRG